MTLGNWMLKQCAITISLTIRSAFMDVKELTLSQLNDSKWILFAKNKSLIHMTLRKACKYNYYHLLVKVKLSNKQRSMPSFLFWYRLLSKKPFCLDLSPDLLLKWYRCSTGHQLVFYVHYSSYDRLTWFKDFYEKPSIHAKCELFCRMNRGFPLTACKQTLLWIFCIYKPSSALDFLYQQTILNFTLDRFLNRKPSASCFIHHTIAISGSLFPINVCCRFLASSLGWSNVYGE